MVPTSSTCARTPAIPTDERNWNMNYYREACRMLQSTSLVPRSDGNYNDNFFTPLGIGGPYNQEGLYERWKGGQLMYNNEMVAHWYGDTIEEFVENVLEDYPEYASLQGGRTSGGKYQVGTHRR